MFPCLGAGMVLNKENRNRLTELIARRQAALTGVAGSAPAGPLTVAQDSPNPTRTDKNKGVVAIDSEDEEGLVFKRPRVGVTTTSLSAIDGHPPSFREHPPAPPLLADSSCSKAMGRALLRVTKCPLPLSSPPYSNKPPNASKRRRQRRPWAETC